MLSEPIPQTYRPYDELVLCGNRLLTVRVPVRVKQFPVMLIGKNSPPRIWLAAPLTKEADQWRFIVEDNKSVIPNVQVEISSDQRVVNLMIAGYNLLTVTQESPEKAIVSHIDLRLIGLSIFGDGTTLHVGGANFTGSTFSSTDTMIAVG